jgi:hypothetical protein
MTRKNVAGHLYWKSSAKDPECTVIPNDSGTPVGSYLSKHALTEEEMGLPLSWLARLYPCMAEVEK